MPAPATVVALHPGGFGTSYWDDVKACVPELAFVTPHLGLIADEVGGDGAALMDALEAQLPDGPCIFAGVSLGTLFAVELAARCGQRTRGVFLLSGGPAIEDMGWLDKLKGMMSFLGDAFDPAFATSLTNVLLYRGGARFAKLSERVRASLLAEAGPRSVSLGRAVLTRPRLMQEALEHIRAPIEVWLGRYDPSIEDGWRSEWAAHGKVTVVEETSHHIPLEAPERVAAELRRLGGDAAPTIGR